MMWDVCGQRTGMHCNLPVPPAGRAVMAAAGMTSVSLVSPVVRQQPCPWLHNSALASHACAHAAATSIAYRPRASGAVALNWTRALLLPLRHRTHTRHLQTAAAA